MTIGSRKEGLRKIQFTFKNLYNFFLIFHTILLIKEGHVIISRRLDC